MSSLQALSASELAEARVKLKTQQDDAAALAKRIYDAEEQLAQIIAESKLAIDALEDEKHQVELKIQRTKAYLSPMRRLPDDLLRELFWFEFEMAPCCAWVLGAVCTRWRRIVLNMHRIWSRVCTQSLCFAVCLVSCRFDW